MAKNTNYESDLRLYCDPEIPNNPGICVPESVCTAFEIIQKRKTNNADRLSRMFCYYYSRTTFSNLPGRPGSKALIMDALAGAKSAGIALETDCPWDDAKLHFNPSPEAHRSASERKIVSYSQLSGPRDVKTVLSKKLPVIMGLNLWSSFNKINGSGLMPFPDQRKEKIVNNHSVCIVGYRSADDTLICRNNWGKEWGDHGYFYLPYRVMAYPDFLISLWAIDSINIS